MRHSLLISIAMIAMLFASCGNNSTEIANSEGVEVNIHNEESDSLLEEEEEDFVIDTENINNYWYDYIFGVRPVIEISKNYFE